MTPRLIVSEDRYLSLAISAWKWIESQAIVNDESLSWSVSQGYAEMAVDDLYSGIPGGILLAAAMVA